jgi:hypothetical protein
MHQIMVNIKTAGIFKGIFEIQKSTRSAKNFAEIRVLATWGSRVYHAGIYHDAPAAGLYVALTRRWSSGPPLTPTLFQQAHLGVLVTWSPHPQAAILGKCPARGVWVSLRAGQCMAACRASGSNERLGKIAVK